MKRLCLYQHPIRVINRKFGLVNARYRGLKKNTSQLITPFALSNLWMERSKLMRVQVRVRPGTGQKLCKWRNWLSESQKTTKFQVIAREILLAENQLSATPVAGKLS